MYIYIHTEQCTDKRVYLLPPRVVWGMISLLAGSGVVPSTESNPPDGLFLSIVVYLKRHQYWSFNINNALTGITLTRYRHPQSFSLFDPNLESYKDLPEIRSKRLIISKFYKTFCSKKVQDFRLCFYQRYWNFNQPK